jgi:hypothetical protein
MGFSSVRALTPVTLLGEHETVEIKKYPEHTDTRKLPIKNQGKNFKKYFKRHLYGKVLQISIKTLKSIHIFA